MPGIVVAFAAAGQGNCMRPTCRSGLATNQLSRPDTSPIGGCDIKHRIIAPGPIGVVSSCVVGDLIEAARSMV